jgi:hypothetical protein
VERTVVRGHRAPGETQRRHKESATMIEHSGSLMDDVAGRYYGEASSAKLR